MNSPACWRFSVPQAGLSRAIRWQIRKTFTGEGTPETFGPSKRMRCVSLHFAPAASAQSVQ